MYAIVNTGGKQYKVATDDVITVEKLEGKGEKQLVFKFHKRKRYRRLKGHRQQLTKIKITKVQATSRARKATKVEAPVEAPVAE